MFKKKTVIISMVLALSVLLSSCSSLDNLYLKLGLKNDSFEYIKQGRIEKVVIQNARDNGFRFVVTDKDTITELYDILSKAKKADKKSELASDYIIELYESPAKIYKFNYVAGLDKNNYGNLYSDSQYFTVSSRLDNDIIKNFWNSRKPINFDKVYYKSILDSIKKYKKEVGNYNSISVKVYDDVDVLKYILSVELNDFKSDLKSEFKEAVFIENADQSENSDVEINVSTEGYMRNLYKSIITFYNRETKKEVKYYIWDTYDYDTRTWTYNIYTSSNKPKDF